MIKQPIQPIKFFASYLEIVKDWEKRDKGNPGTHIITEDVVFLPSFQIKFEWRGSIVDDFFHHIYLFDYNTGVGVDITADLRAFGVSNYGSFQNFIMYRFPLWVMATPGEYYIRISDGALGGADVNEIWYSEVFRLCDLNRNLLTSFTGSANWNTFNGVDYISTRDVYDVRVCEAGTQSNTIDSNAFYVTKDEPLDFYIFGVATSMACGDDTFLPLQFSLIDSGGTVMSNVIDGVLGMRHFRLTPTKTTVVTLRGENLGVNGKSEWLAYLYYANPQLNTGLTDVFSYDHENIGLRKVLRWSNSCNICDMIYTERAGYNHNDDSFLLSYENYLILDDPPLIPDFAIVETVSENDKGDKSLLLGSHQEWYYLQLGTSENLAKAIQNIHLLTDGSVEIDYNGEAHTICENSTEISVMDDHNFTTKFRFREESCPVQSCCFDACCPNLLPIQDVLSTLSGLPPASYSNAGLRYLVLVGGVYYIYESDGDTWNQLPLLNTEPNCIMDLDAVADGDQTPYMYWDDVNSNWYRLVYITSVADTGVLQATLTLRNYSKPGLTVIVNYQLATGDLYKSAEITLAGTAGETIVLTVPGAGTWYFRIEIWDGDCYYGFTNIVNGAIS
jgi:hypothetical protein